ncbi:MAG TPA: VOC family protein [Chloroflexota bacterium]|nr:VOC family protein [Chloroflexota bacterium]
MEDQRPGAAYWIDHYVVPVTDIERWDAFYTNVLGAQHRQMGGGGPRRPSAAPPTRFTFVSTCHVGGALRTDGLPPSSGLGRGLPRYSYFVRSEDLDEHLRRLDRFQVPHSDAMRTSEEGEDGIAIRFEDPDGNQLEFWAPDRLPQGAMEDETAVKVGRVAGALFESRDLARTADFYTRYCGVDPVSNADLPHDVLVLKLAAGGRIAFKKVDALSGRTGGHIHPLHTALVVRDDEMMQVYRRMWDELVEWDHDPTIRRLLPDEEAQSLPARTGIHGSPSGQPWRTGFGRGDSFWDWDTNAFHWVPGAPIDGSMTTFKALSPYPYIDAFVGSDSA